MNRTGLSHVRSNQGDISARPVWISILRHFIPQERLDCQNWISEKHRNCFQFLFMQHFAYEGKRVPWNEFSKIPQPAERYRSAMSRYRSSEMDYHSSEMQYCSSVMEYRSSVTGYRSFVMGYYLLCCCLTGKNSPQMNNTYKNRPGLFPASLLLL